MRRLAPARAFAFTLIELLVVVAILALLMAILLPSLGRAREQARTTRCLTNLKAMETAHWMYISDNDQQLIQAGFAHGGAHANEQLAWMTTLQTYYNNKLVARCPSDFSPHWPTSVGGRGVPVPPSADQFRRTSYGINEFTDRNLIPWGGPYSKIEHYPRPADTIHFLEMANEGEFAGADHPHVDLWVGNVLLKAYTQLQANQHGGATRTWTGRANYSFLVGHAETLSLNQVFENMQRNRFDPAGAW